MALINFNKKLWHIPFMMGICIEKELRSTQSLRMNLQWNQLNFYRGSKMAAIVDGSEVRFLQHEG